MCDTENVNQFFDDDVVNACEKRMAVDNASDDSDSDSELKWRAMSGIGSSTRRMPGDVSGPSTGDPTEGETLGLNDSLPNHQLHSLHRLATRSDPVLPMPWIEMQCAALDVLPECNVLEMELSSESRERAKYRERLVRYVELQRQRDATPPATSSASTDVDDKDVQQRRGMLLCGGNALYVFMRCHHFLFERLVILNERYLNLLHDAGADGYGLPVHPDSSLLCFSNNFLLPAFIGLRTQRQATGKHAFSATCTTT